MDLKSALLFFLLLRLARLVVESAIDELISRRLLGSPEVESVAELNSANDVLKPVRLLIGFKRLVFLCLKGYFKDRVSDK
jgi:hypothetical protein